MTRPAVLPSWATNANFPAGALDWSGFPTRVQPSAGKAAQGFEPNSDVPAEEINWLIGLQTDWIAYLDAAVASAAFGDGSDGPATMDGIATVAGMAPIANVYIATRDLFFSSLTVNAGITLSMAGFRLFVKGTLTTGAGALIHANGGSTSGQGGAATGSTGTLLSGYAGGNGGNGAAGTVGTDAPTASLGGSGGAGGADLGGHAGVAGGTATAPTAALGSPRAWSPSLAGVIVGLSAGVAAITAIRGGAGGGGGGGSGGGNIGGGGGAGGGVLAVAARTLSLNAASNIKAAGGGGANANVGGGPFGSGGGGGGGGGVLILAYVSKALSGGGTPVFSAATNCPGGLGGTSTTGIAGDNGANGTLIEFPLDGGAGSGPSGVHVERGTATFTGAEDSITVTFSSAFAAATGAGGYWAVATPYVSDGTIGVTVEITGKTTTQMTLQPSVRFTGEVYWKVEQ